MKSVLHPDGCITRSMNRSKLFRFMSNASVDSPTPDPDSAENEVQCYLSTSCVPEDSDPLHQNSLPKLCKLALHQRVMPASSASVERLFSVGGKMFRPERFRRVRGYLNTSCAYKTMDIFEKASEL